jgi:predicted nucleotidyltransferase
MRSKKYSVSEQAILTTILYSDIFSFPLKKDEIWSFLICEKKVSPHIFNAALLSLRKQVIYIDGFFCLKGREEIIAKRKKNSKEMMKKRKRAEQVAEKLAQIPSILFIGVSGGLASGNVAKDDDIDLVIIVKKDTVFTTRLLIICVLEFLGVRRSRNQEQTADTICVNLLFDEAALDWSHFRQDVYTAREIAQIIPVFERNDMYLRFITSNKWIKQFLPNVKFANKNLLQIASHVFLTGIVWIILNPVSESLSRRLQMRYMNPHRTTEVVSKHFLAFHPNDYRTQTLRRLRLKMRQFGLLTNI